jgi:hypothetical protein
MNKKELFEKFEKNVNYLKRNIPPDDIYVFAEQTFMAALFFIHKWSEWVTITEEMDKDKVVHKWVSNILGFHEYRIEGKDIDLDLNLNMEEE